MASSLPEGFRHFSIAATAPQPWKNGGGVTRALAARQSGHDTLWRISVADIDQDGAFSVLPNIDRVSVLMAGPGLRLCGDYDTHVFAAVGSQATYAGETALDAQLGTGPARLLNIMTRRGHAASDVQLRQARCVQSAAAPLVVVVLTGSVRARAEDGSGCLLTADHGLQTTRSHLPIELEADSADASWAVITLREIKRASTR